MLTEETHKTRRFVPFMIWMIERDHKEKEQEELNEEEHQHQHQHQRLFDTQNVVFISCQHVSCHVNNYHCKEIAFHALTKHNKEYVLSIYVYFIVLAGKYLVVVI